METSLTDGSIISYLRYAHGLYNSLVILLFLYQGQLGWRIRKERLRGSPPTVKRVKRHRKLGPFSAILGISGFPAGMAVAYLDEGHIFEHPFHFVTGSTVVVLIVLTFILSKKIKGRESPWRSRHFIAGITLLFAYFLQAFWGIGILF